MQKVYRLRKQSSDDILEQLLISRGKMSLEEQTVFLNPSFETGVHDPYLLKDMDKAVRRIVSAVAANEPIVIYSDYDADGIPGGVIMHDFFKKIGYTNFSNYIPHRHREGFGLNMNAIKEFRDGGTKLIITIDCGIADYTEIEYAQQVGIDVIVTDHHEVSHGIPPAFAIINPKQSDCLYPEKMLCGSGVVFKLIQGLIATQDFAISKGWEKWLLDMVGLATLSDMVPLQNENRVLAKFGLLVLQKSPRPGLVKLLRKNRVSQRHVSEDDIGFTISPRINAASRLGEPRTAFELLAGSTEVAERAADNLEKINTERKSTVALLVKSLKKEITERYGDAVPPIIAMGNPQWMPSLLGLVCSSIAESFHRPVFLWGREGGDEIKGSCRSDGSLSVLDVLSRIDTSIISSYGGHAMAGGFVIDPVGVHQFEEAFQSSIVDSRISTNSTKVCEVDALLTLDTLTQDFFRKIQSLAPFGVGNEKPIFAFVNARISAVKAFGKEKQHTELTLVSDTKNIKAISFFVKPEQYSVLQKQGVDCSIIGTLEQSYFGGKQESRIRIVDIIECDKLHI